MNEAIETLEMLVISCNCLAFVHPRKPFWRHWHEMPDSIRDKLKQLRSEDTLKLRDDYVRKWIG